MTWKKVRGGTEVLSECGQLREGRECLVEGLDLKLGAGQASARGRCGPRVEIGPGQTIAGALRHGRPFLAPLFAWRGGLSQSFPM